jgi:hypothetical protein
MPGQVKDGNETDNPEAHGAVDERKDEKQHIADYRADEDA